MLRNSQNYLTILFFIVLSGAIVTPSFAQESKPLLDKNKLSIGGGISDNSVGRNDDTGYQLFVAYDLNQVNVMEGVASSMEFGLMDYGFRRDNTGIWGNYVVKGAINGQFDWLARAGLDIGDDSGLMYGAGVGWTLAEKKGLRVEYVVRDEVDSLQFNFLYHL